MHTTTADNQLFEILEKLFSRKDLLLCLDDICQAHKGCPLISSHLKEVPLRVYDTLILVVSQEISQLEQGLWQEPELLDEALELMEVLETYFDKGRSQTAMPEVIPSIPPSMGMAH